MNYLLTGTAVAALAIATPLWAQAPSTYSSGMPSATGTTPYAQPAPAMPQAPASVQQGAATPRQPAPVAQQAPAQRAPMRAPGATTGRMPEQAAEGATQPMATHHAMRGHHRRHHGAGMAHTTHRGGQMNDNIADQLNREEANRVASGGTMPPGSMSQMPMMQQGGPGQMAMPPGSPPAPGPRPSGSGSGR